MTNPSTSSSSSSSFSSFSPDLGASSSQQSNQGLRWAAIRSLHQPPAAFNGGYQTAAAHPLVRNAPTSGSSTTVGSSPASPPADAPPSKYRAPYEIRQYDPRTGASGRGTRLERCRHCGAEFEHHGDLIRHSRTACPGKKRKSEDKSAPTLRKQAGPKTKRSPSRRPAPDTRPPETPSSGPEEGAAHAAALGRGARTGFPLSIASILNAPGSPG